MQDNSATGVGGPLRVAASFNTTIKARLRRWDAVPTEPARRTSFVSAQIIHATLSLLLLVSLQCFAGAQVDLVRVLKAERKLQLTSEGKVLNEFHVVLGGNPKGHKEQEGDKRTPEGKYILDYKKENSAFYKAIHISYPNGQDNEAAKKRGVSAGGQIMIHGQKNGLGWLSFVSQRFDWTNGCVALSNSDIDVVWALVKAGTPIELLP